MTFAGFSVVNRIRCESPQGFNHALDSWSASDWMTALVGEVGEAANLVKKLNRVRDGIPGNDKTPDELRAALRREVADIFIYLDLFAQSLGLDLAAAVREKFNETSRKIGCPIEC
jgi:NTP pyrophosphatase (non-canonical NTP hydrolase)